MCKELGKTVYNKIGLELSFLYCKRDKFVKIILDDRSQTVYFIDCQKSDGVLLIY